MNPTRARLWRLRTRTADSQRDERGYTLIELMIVSAIFAIVITLIFGTLTSVQKSEAYTRDRTLAVQSMRDAMDRMTRELRQATNIVPTPSISHVEFDTYDLGKPVHITYDATGPTLTRQVGTGTPATLLTGLVSTSLFTYSPDTNTTTAVDIDLQLKPSNMPNTIVELKSDVELRNLTPEDQ
jgi:prepilin-type N-terminal cleavage/methylation domain-containing protein